MTTKAKILFASRALESPPQEGGFVLLRDIATRLALDPESSLAPSMFSKSKSPYEGISPDKVFTVTGWNRRSKLEFFVGLLRRAHLYDIVHAAHIPTTKNARLMSRAIRRAKRRGTKFVQTITGLPVVDDKQLSQMLWGDSIVCQSPSVYQRVRRLTSKPVSLIVPWPSTVRVSADNNRLSTTRSHLLSKKNTGPIVVFPGEFERMGIDTTFADCLSRFIEHNPGCLIILACRFDRLGVGDKLAAQFPDNVQSLGKTSNIIELMEAADLVIFPTRKMDEKFHPPLIITEALSLVTRVLVSNKIDIEPATSPLLSIEPSSSSWARFADAMHEAVHASHSKIPEASKSGFDSMFHDYLRVYSDIQKDVK